MNTKFYLIDKLFEKKKKVFLINSSNTLIIIKIKKVFEYQYKNLF